MTRSTSGSAPLKSLTAGDTATRLSSVPPSSVSYTATNRCVTAARSPEGPLEKLAKSAWTPGSAGLDKCL